ncbi:hypothetical protein KP509_06G017500 [Ceratopteris richardii]|uniref:60S ribosomal protein L18a-like protein n=1 Tax=Ceratopteris richardii TaxID=49495 RepID=A0A8T2UDU7_CERRI|nr:hypothetical protein KP509_06G017500 [Ceratopteris richardii]
MKDQARSDETQGYQPLRQEHQQHYYYSSQPQQTSRETPQASAPPYYGTFQGYPGYPQSVGPGYPSRIPPQYVVEVVPGYPVLEPRLRPELSRLPCCGLGAGWCLFISGFFLASLPWYVGVVMLMCTNHDPRERVGLVFCTVAVILSIIGFIIGGTSAAD